jgi:hypothetical protein
VKITFWPYSKDPYEIYRILLKDPRISKSQMTRVFKVNPKTLDTWWKAAFEKRIIIPPVFRRKSFLNFREYFYFLKVEDPYEFYESLQKENSPVTYFSVHTGFCNFQIISKEPIDLPVEKIISGPRSDYHVTIPPNCSFEEGVIKIEELLKNVEKLESRESPLQYHGRKYEPWDEMDESIFWEICNNIRTPFTSVIRSIGTYNDKTWSWFRNRDTFGDTITMFFPKGESSYQLSLYFIKTEYDSILIDIFSQLPTSTLFYRVLDRLIMCIYLPFFPSPEARIIPQRVLSTLKKMELVDEYTNSNAEYGYRP